MAKSFSLIFVTVQFVALGWIAFSGPLFPNNRPLLLIELLGIGLGLWAVLVMGIGKFGITPEPLVQSRLMRRGPYRLIRHPMYLALLVVTLPLVLTKFSLLRLMIWFVLLVDLVLKLRYEEALLVVRLEGYREYMRQSYRLLPFVY